MKKLLYLALCILLMPQCTDKGSRSNDPLAIERKWLDSIDKRIMINNVDISKDDIENSVQASEREDMDEILIPYCRLNKTVGLRYTIEIRHTTYNDMDHRSRYARSYVIKIDNRDDFMIVPEIKRVVTPTGSGLKESGYWIIDTSNYHQVEEVISSAKTTIRIKGENGSFDHEVMPIEKQKLKWVLDFWKWNRYEIDSTAASKVS